MYFYHPNNHRPPYLGGTLPELPPERSQRGQLLPDVVQGGLQQRLVVLAAAERVPLDLVRVEQVAHRLGLLVEPDVQLEQVDPRDHVVLQLDPLLTQQVHLLLDVIALTVLQILQAGGQPGEQVVDGVAFDLWAGERGKTKIVFIFLKFADLK